MEFLALILIVAAGVVGWNAGRGHGQNETAEKERDRRKSEKDLIIQKFKDSSSHSSVAGIKHLNYPIVDTDSEPLVLIQAVDLISLITSSQLYASGGDPSDATWHQKCLNIIADKYLAESHEFSEAQKTAIKNYFT